MATTTARYPTTTAAAARWRRPAALVALVALAAGAVLAWSGGPWGLLGALLAAAGGGVVCSSRDRPAAAEAPPDAAAPCEANASEAGGRHGADLMVAQVVPVWSRQVDFTRTAASDGLAQVLQVFADMSRSLGTLADTLAAPRGPLDASAQSSAELQQTAIELREQIERAFVHFQFGDRISQMLSIIGNDMDNFADWVAAHPRATHSDAAQWLAALESSYTMDEQRSQHHGNRHVERSSDVEFF